MVDAFEDPHARDERYVWFMLRGDFDPAEITRATGLTPTKAFMKGTRPRPRASLRTVSGWILDSGLGPSDEVVDHLTDLLARLRPGWEALHLLAREHEAFISAAIYCYQAQGPWVAFSPAHVAAIADLGATIDIDIYALAEESPPEVNGAHLLTRHELAGLGRAVEEA